MTPGTPPEDAERRRFEKALDDVGENLPSELPEVEGADVGRVVRKGLPADEASDEGRH